MSPRPLRARLLDLAVATVCVACVASPLLPGVGAASDSAVVESSGTVDQRVLQSGIISSPLGASFERGSSGTLDGSVSWDTYTTAPAGMKLVVSSERAPAMRDGQNGIDIGDLAATPAPWSVAAGDRRFGFSATGAQALARYDGGAKWRGFEGTRAVEVARRGAASPTTRTRIKLRAEFRAALPAGARPAATVNATAVANL